MEEEQKVIQPAAPPRFRGHLIKVMTLTLFFLILLFTVGFLGFETTSSSKFCSSCHEMKPEYYTWKASSHSEVDCVNCHTGSSKEDYAKAKANGLVQVFKKATNTYTAPIRMPDKIPNSACEKCHNMDARSVSPSGDLIIPHDKHSEKNIACIQCHNGIAHGKIASRNITYKTDYSKWDKMLGQQIMKDTKFQRPTMEKCMDCHKARKVTIECTACHTTGMFPKSHKIADFKFSTHGSTAKNELEDCNSCHKYMSRKKIAGFEKIASYTKFLRNERSVVEPLVASEYAKQNTFCKDCHSQKPPSHSRGFVKSHGPIAEESKEKCLACHDFQKDSTSNITKITCASCHPSSHYKNTYKERHPIQLDPNQKLVETCYTCHMKKTCASCHRD
jgi:nitrate/TMAO reductase-like tetraheme cytochrome c subunit